MSKLQIFEKNITQDGWNSLIQTVEEGQAQHNGIPAVIITAEYIFWSDQKVTNTVKSKFVLARSMFVLAKSMFEKSEVRLGDVAVMDKKYNIVENHSKFKARYEECKRIELEFKNLNDSPIATLEINNIDITKIGHDQEIITNHINKEPKIYTSAREKIARMNMLNYNNI